MFEYRRYLYNTDLPVFFIMNKEDFTKIGRIVKVNKKTANITVISDFTLPDSIEQSKILFIEIDGGLVPFFVIEASLRGDNSLVVMLEDYHLPEKALKLVGCKVYIKIEEIYDSEDEFLFYPQLIGFKVIDEDKGEVGVVKEVSESMHQVLLTVMKDKKEILIPLAEEFITKVNRHKKELFMVLPDGLIDL